MKRTNRSPVLRIVGMVGLAVTVAVGVPSAAAAPGDPPDEEETWVGDVEKHGRHYDYIGQSCPIDYTDCPDYIVRYEIVPTSTQAARALPKVAGHRARLIGRKEPLRKPGHNGMLMVSEVQSKRARPGPLDREPPGGSGVSPGDEYSFAGYRPAPYLGCSTGERAPEEVARHGRHGFRPDPTASCCFPGARLLARLI